MALITTNALCLRKIDFSETSQILTFVSDSLGLCGAIAKGAKRAKSSIGGPLDILCLYRTVLYDRSRRGTLSIVAQAELIEFFPNLRSDFAKFRASQSLRELLLSAPVAPHDGAATLLVAVRALRALENDAPIGPTLAHFAWRFLGVLGITPTVTHCAISGREASGEHPVRFSIREMGILAPAFEDNRHDLVELSAHALQALQSLDKGYGGEDLDVDAWRSAFTLLAHLIAMQGGRRLKTVPMLRPLESA